jgi:NitT/TauT family transport system substrate-binding protein
MGSGLRSRGLVAAIAAVAAAVLMVGCGEDEPASGGGGGSGGGGEAAEVTQLKVGIIPIVDVAPLYLGIEKGFFEERGLEVTPQPAQGGAAIVPAVLSGDNQIGFSNTVSLLIAQQEDLPLKIISQGVVGAETEERSWNQVIVPKGSPIEEPKDLEGKTIAVNALNNIGEVTIRTSLDEMGVDSSKVKFLEVPFPDMPATLGEGRVDAAWMVEPFASAAIGEGGTALFANDVGLTPGLTIATYFASEQYISQNQDVVDRFIEALHESLNYAQRNEAEVRRIVPTYTQIPEEVAAEMKLPIWGPDLNRETIELTGQKAQEYGLLEAPPNLDELVYEKAEG